MVSKEWKIKFENKIIEELIFRYFKISIFEILKYRSFYISSFQILTPTRNFKVSNIKITKDELFNSFIFELIFSLFTNYLHNLIIFQMVKVIIFKLSKL